MSQDERHHRMRLGKRSKRALLLLTIPLALVGSYVMLIVTAFGWCGVSGCSGGGFGRITEPYVGIAVGASVIAAAIWFVALALPRWVTPTRARLIIAGFIGVFMGFMVLLWGTAWFVTG